MSAPCVEVTGVSKRFARTGRARTLAELVSGAWRRWAAGRDAEGLRPGEFFALRDVSFQVRPGEMLGIIGPNGSGKSTVLKLLTRILRPDAGVVAVRGRAGGLIELGAGFHPYLSGRENVAINGVILGLSRAEVRRKYDSIVEFAGLAEFMDMPVKDYSSGMYARLAFAIAAHAEPDVLVVDEVLAVGDAAFQVKCYDWIASRRRGGGAVVLVSHEMHNIRPCDRVLYLNQGRAAALGEPADVVARYLADSGGSGARADEVGFVADVQGRPLVEITRVQWLGPDGAELETLTPGQGATVRLHFEARAPLNGPMFALSLFHDDPRFGLAMRGYLVHLHSGGAFAGRTLEGTGAVEVEVEALHLPAGRYRCKVYVFDGAHQNPLYARDGAARLECVRPAWGDARGLIDVRQRWQVAAPAARVT
ncbi:MAG: ABC transporter ATP-binding protein [Planctomycetes bacterium]|jgi:ABC-type polysaccharide/polyol phosphate transport system ATPase subunit|nr:ABC transporter ATP-binding protein [Planctomycetota bacterium]MCL4730161.1 ABC transporter ATP-binding protein [Planctomycetota bacterium]